MKLPATKRLRATDIPGIPPLSGIIPKSTRKEAGPFWLRVTKLDHTHRSDLGLRSRSRACPPKLPGNYRYPLAAAETTTEKKHPTHVLSKPKQKKTVVTEALRVWKINNQVWNSPKEFRIFRKNVLDYGLKEKKKPFYRWTYTDPWQDVAEMEATPCKKRRPVANPVFTIKNLPLGKIPAVPNRIWRKII